MTDISITTSESTTALPGRVHRETVVEKIIALAMTGLSRSQIAKEVGWTRSAVIGALWRRKIPGPITKPKPACQTAPSKCEPDQAQTDQAADDDYSGDDGQGCNIAGRAVV